VPNPFNPGTTIHYSVPHTGAVTVCIYDVTGRLVRTLVSDTRPTGEWTAEWNGRDDARGRVGSGVYFCRVRSGGEAVVHKLVLLR
jgi:flagellar hook assembly protein FlgD